jgi:hypothetical protein
MYIIVVLFVVVVVVVILLLLDLDLHQGFRVWGRQLRAEALAKGIKG